MFGSMGPMLNTQAVVESGLSLVSCSREILLSLISAITVTLAAGRSPKFFSRISNLVFFSSPSISFTVFDGPIHGLVYAVSYSIMITTAAILAMLVFIKKYPISKLA